MVRHYSRLSQMNYGLDTHFYPLGSCTMKYNPKINEDMARLPGFARLHPLAPEAASQGALQLMHELARDLAEISGMDEVSLQPAAGAQGELAGVLMIRAYHLARGERRHKVLIPDSAHGTNPASTALAGFSVVELKSDANGEVDPEDLARNLDEDVAAFMITQPNTLGLFESRIHQITEMCHAKGVQVYMDGANFNAILGITRPGRSRLRRVPLQPAQDLHHAPRRRRAGGRPGRDQGASGPVPARARGRQGRRTTYRLEWNRPQTIGKLQAFWGNFGMLVRAYAYIRTMGPDGLRSVSDNAVLNANYIQKRLEEHYDRSAPGPCMHECVLSARRQKRLGVAATDIAKRLLDCGFYAPSVYFPLIVEEALMIEPTETESKETLDEFCDAMIRIAREAESSPEIVREAPSPRRCAGSTRRSPRGGRICAGPAGRQREGDALPASVHRAARRRGQHGAGRGAPAEPPPEGRAAHPPPLRLEAADDLARLRPGARRQHRSGNRRAHGDRARPAADRRQRHPPRGAGARADLQRGRRGDGLSRRRRPARDVPLDRLRAGRGASAASAPAPRWCPSGRPTRARCRRSASPAPAPTSSRWTDRSWWAAPSGRQGAGFLQHGAVMLGASLDRLRRVFPGEVDPLAGMTTLEAVLGRRPSFAETAEALVLGFREVARAGARRRARSATRRPRRPSSWRGPSTPPRSGRAPAGRRRELRAPLMAELVREFPDAPRAAVGAVVLEGDQVLLVRRGAPPSQGKWSIPGGLVHLGERLEEAVVREVMEESGLEVRILGLCGVIDRVVPAEAPAAAAPIRYHYVIVDYVATPIGGALRAGSDAAEARWVSIDDLPSYETTDALLAMIQRAVKLRQATTQGGMIG